jgi:glycosyltransferase involved in cell wall biosynthesis
MIEALRGKRVALVHHWLMSMRGGEKTLEAIARLIPDAPIFTMLANVEALSDELRCRQIRTSFLQRLPGAKALHRRFLPLYPAAARSLDATGFDVVVCSDASVAKGIRTSPDALIICYCHSPMRYVWDLYDEYRARTGFLQRAVLAALVPRLREWDRRAADRVTAFVANSHHVAGRIARHYGRKSVTIYPPVRQFGLTERRPEDFYLVLGEQVEYKRSDLAVEACRRLGRKLVVIGDGPMLPELRKRSDGNIRFLGWQPDAAVRDCLSRCRAVLFCGQEDFGMVPVEAQSMGRPVIAYNAGGAAETVVNGSTGILFDSQSVEAVSEAILKFERSDGTWSGAELVASAARFSEAVFDREFTDFVTWCVRTYEAGGAAAVRHTIEAAVPEPRTWADFSAEAQAAVGAETGHGAVDR